MLKFLALNIQSFSRPNSFLDYVLKFDDLSLQPFFSGRNIREVSISISYQFEIFLFPFFSQGMLLFDFTLKIIALFNVITNFAPLQNQFFLQALESCPAFIDLIQQFLVALLVSLSFSFIRFHHSLEVVHSIVPLIYFSLQSFEGVVLELELAGKRGACSLFLLKL